MLKEIAPEIIYDLNTIYDYHKPENGEMASNVAKAVLFCNLASEYLHNETMQECVKKEIEYRRNFINNQLYGRDKNNKCF